jgi:hypothetical protein
MVNVGAVTFGIPGVGDGEAVGGGVGVGEAVGGGVGVGLAVGGGVGVGDAVGGGVGVGLAVGGGVGVGLADGVGVSVGVGVAPVMVIKPLFCAGENEFRSTSMNSKSFGGLPKTNVVD